MSWPDSSTEREFKKWVEYGGDWENKLSFFTRNANDALEVLVVWPTPATYEWLERVHKDAAPETAKFSRDIHLSIHTDGVRVSFYPRKDDVLASRTADRKEARALASRIAFPNPKLVDVPKALERQAGHLARKAWDAFPTHPEIPPLVQFYKTTKQLQVLVECTRNGTESPKITFDDLHQFVGSVDAIRAWVECSEDASRLIVGARVKADVIRVGVEEQEASEMRKRVRSGE